MSTAAPTTSADGLFGPAATHPRSAALLAALGLSSSAILFALSDTSPTTATFFRCLYALPFLWLIARREDRLAGPRSARARRWALLAGLFFAADLVLFHESILLMGAGLATVLSNLQVVIVLLAAWLVWGERPSGPQAAGVPIALAGIVLISGVLGGDAFGADPLLGSLIGIVVAATYAAYLLLLRKGRDRRHAAGPILDATLAAAAGALVAGIVLGDIELLPSLPAHGWLVVLALSAQVGGGILVAVALPRLPAATTSLLLLLQPVLAVGLGMLVLAEAPSPVQLIGVALVIGGVALGSLARPGRGGRGTLDAEVGHDAPAARERLPSADPS